MKNKSLVPKCLQEQTYGPSSLLKTLFSRFFFPERKNVRIHALTHTRLNTQHFPALLLLFYPYLAGVLPRLIHATFPIYMPFIHPQSISLFRPSFGCWIYLWPGHPETHSCASRIDSDKAQPPNGGNSKRQQGDSQNMG